MTLVRGSVVSWKPCSMSRAARIIGKFLDEDDDTATDPSVKNYLRRAAADFQTSSPSDLPIPIADEVDALPKHLHTHEGEGEEQVCDDSRHAKSSKNINDHTSVSSVKKKKKRKHRDQDPTESELVDTSKKKKRKKNEGST